jgi:putative nucleotidyltransferase with HDIG domain
MFSQIRTSDFYREHWYHSILTAFLSRTIARRCGHREHADEAFLAGLFHDIGRVVLYLADPERYGSLMRGDTRRGESFRRLERETFGTDHHELAAALFEEWRFPSLYVDTAREHNTANITSPHKTLIVFVTVADILTEQAVTGRSDADRQELLHKLLPHTCLTVPDAAAYTTGLAESLSDDPLFAECLQMYGFTASDLSAPGER